MDFICVNVHSSLGHPSWTLCSSHTASGQFTEYSLFTYRYGLDYTATPGWYCFLIYCTSHALRQGSNVPSIITSCSCFPVGLKYCFLYHFIWPVTEALPSTLCFDRLCTHFPPQEVNFSGPGPYLQIASKWLAWHKVVCISCFLVNRWKQWHLDFSELLWERAKRQ